MLSISSKSLPRHALLMPHLSRGRDSNTDEMLTSLPAQYEQSHISISFVTTLDAAADRMGAASVDHLHADSFRYALGTGRGDTGDALEPSHDRVGRISERHGMPKTVKPSVVPILPPTFSSMSTVNRCRRYPPACRLPQRSGTRHADWPIPPAESCPRNQLPSTFAHCAR